MLEPMFIDNTLKYKNQINVAGLCVTPDYTNIHYNASLNLIYHYQNVSFYQKALSTKTNIEFILNEIQVFTLILSFSKCTCFIIS